MCDAASAVKPTIAFIGVRMSCDMLFRNEVLARFACSAAVSASESASRFAVAKPSQLTAGAPLPESAGSPAPMPSACEQPKGQTDKEEKEPAHAENALHAPENAGLQDAQASVAPGSSDEAAAECVNTDGKLHGEDALAADTEPMT